MVSELSSMESRELSRLYRELKMETLKVKALNESFLNYINEVKTVTAAWMDTIVPAQNGKLYTRKGSQAAQDVRNVVFCHHM
jgi:hypothetical protein